ncbi:MAG: hypothetical protein OXD01_12850 [Gammaproteobacteria bacterium]|nr:hypothetical protein [Gammaproteobacteria bacterium]
MEDKEHDKKFATRSGNNQPSGESLHAKRNEKNEFADYSAWKSGREKSDEVQPRRRKKSAKPEQETTDSEPDNSDQNPPGNGEEAQKADTLEETGKTSKDGERKEGELPDWMKRRLAREKKRSEAMEQSNAELRKQLSEAKAAQESTAKQQTKSQETQADKESQTSEGPYDYDYPDEDDYKNSKGEVDDDAYLADVKNWHDEKPLVGGKHAKTKKPEAKTDTSQQEPTEAQNKKQIAEQQFKIALESIEQAFDDSETAPKGLFDDFFDQARRGLTKYSYTMIDWMADHEPEAILLATEFIERPRKALNIFRKPVSQQTKLLSDLAKTLKSQAGREKNNDPEIEDGTAKAEIGNIKNLRTKRGPDVNKTFDQAAASSDYGTYANARNEMSRNKSRTHVANLF